jgi:hypothetical protein
MSTDTVPPIQVFVTLDVRGNPHVTCSPYGQDVTAPTTLQFTLMTPGWVFPATNAVFLNTPPNPNFPDPSVTVDATLVTWQDAFVALGDIAYSVTVQSAAGTRCTTSDPIIHNGVGCTDGSGGRHHRRTPSAESR